ncbi:serine O-acetyltransferase [Chamaesiphon minutus PCC 6605]|uniref:Serine acetyltransferase n=2 Tax=Chamaesiphon TaxID=217161 RepID=K9U8D7_CHAP6|nr:serine O-acetyltransferase [Chamaesiphon minutus PCC 6605]
MNDTQPLTEIDRDDRSVISRDRFQSKISANPIEVAIADWQTIKQRDPAARNWVEILFCYPGFQAICCYRLCHWLYRLGVPFLPRIIASLTRFFTGIEIHPGAIIGKGVFIDHGTGVVIGETAIIGDGVVIYQGVTLGGTGKETGKRHPTLGDHVLVGAGAKILGNIQIGDRTNIGAGSVVLRDIPSDCTVVGIPGRVIRNGSRTIDPTQNLEYLPDLEAEVISKLFDRIKSLEQQVRDLDERLHPTSEGELKTAHLQDRTENDKEIEDFLYGAGI